MNFPLIDPIAFEIGPLAVRWYGLAYVAGFLGCLMYAKYLARHWESRFTPEGADDFFTWAVLGVILGGRLGYCLFYNPAYYLGNPFEIIKIWEGGMSYHGGLLGVLLAVYLYGRRYKINFFDITDRIAPGVCIGLFFGRIANFINGELYGRFTDVPWGIVFPNAGDLPRHPSQLYEALLEGLLMFVVLHFVAMKKPARYVISGLFALLYGVFRFGVEFVRQPDNLPHLRDGVLGWLTMGQLLTLPLIATGIILLVMSRRVAR